MDKLIALTALLTALSVMGCGFDPTFGMDMSDYNYKVEKVCRDLHTGQYTNMEMCK